LGVETTRKHRYFNIEKQANDYDKDLRFVVAIVPQRVTKVDADSLSFFTHIRHISLGAIRD
jgi:deoxyribodipyrimidine photolyase